MGLVATLFQSELRSLVNRAVAGSPRWAIVGARDAGLVFGRRWAPLTGVVGVLALRTDGLFEPSVEVFQDALPASETEAREAYVRAQRLPYTPRGHTFFASPVASRLCMACARDVLAHDRDRAMIIVERVTKSCDVLVEFREGTAEVTGARVRVPPVRRALMAPVPTPDGTLYDPSTYSTPAEPHASPTYRELTESEWRSVQRLTGVCHE